MLIFYQKLTTIVFVCVMHVACCLLLAACCMLFVYLTESIRLLFRAVRNARRTFAKLFPKLT